MMSAFQAPPNAIVAYSGLDIGHAAANLSIQVAAPAGFESVHYFSAAAAAGAVSEMRVRYTLWLSGKKDLHVG